MAASAAEAFEPTPTAGVRLDRRSLRLKIDYCNDFVPVPDQADTTDYFYLTA
jgi:hypothetical protein